MITYKFLLNNKFIIIKLSGNIKKETLESFMKHLFLRKETTEVSKVLLCYQDVTLDIAINEVNYFVDLRLNNLNNTKNIQTVHMTSTSFETAFAVLYSQKIPKNRADIAICSTLARAIQLLDIDISERELEEQIQNLAFSYRIPDNAAGT